MNSQRSVFFSLFIVMVLILLPAFSLAETKSKKGVTKSISSTKKSKAPKKTDAEKSIHKKKSTLKKNTSTKKTAPGKKTTKKKKSFSQQKNSGTKRVLTRAPRSLQNRVNINTATKDELMQLPGIGPAKANEIIKTRKKIGKFKSADDLMNVKGIGKKTIKNLKPNLRF